MDREESLRAIVENAARDEEEIIWRMFPEWRGQDLTPSNVIG